MTEQNDHDAEARPPVPPVPPSGGSPQTPPTGSGWGSGYGQQPPGYGPQPGYGQQPPPPAAPPQHGPGGYGAGLPPQYGQGQYGSGQHGSGQYGQGQYGAGQYGAPQYGQGPYGGGHVPPPVQRGVVPLRPLGMGEIYDGAFKSIRANPRVMFGLSAIVVTVTVLIETVAQRSTLGALNTLATPSVSSEVELGLDQIWGSLSGVGFSALISFLSVTVLTGLLIISVSRSVIGQQVSLGEAWNRARPMIWRLLGLTLLVVLLTLVVPALWIGLMVLTLVSEAWGLAVLVGLGGGLATLAVVIWISVRTMLATPALVLEEQRVVAGLRRGWMLSRGSFWRLFGIYLLTTIIVSIVASLIVTPAQIVPLVLSLDPLGLPALGLMAVASIIASVLTTPFAAAVTALLYIDVRIRREGLDVELARAAEAAANPDGTPRL